MPLDAGHDWWRSAVIYQVYPRSFADANGDGVGDLPGITSRLPYLADLGVDAIWISPFYPSAHEDGGYDITDFTGVDPIFGSLADVDALIAAAKKIGLRVLLDLVPNHTSRHHPWFVASRASRSAARRNWYIWADPAKDGGPPNNWRAVTGGSAWTFDASTGQYYLHSFFAAQPDLNWRNPNVREAMAGVMRFWLDRGIDGFRVDMIDYLLKDEALRDEPLDENGWYDQPLAKYQLNQRGVVDIMRSLRRVVDGYAGARILLGEVESRLPIDVLVRYYGTAGQLDVLHLPFNFWLLFLPWQSAALERFITDYDGAVPEGAAPNWVLGNHDVPRPATRLGAAQARAAMVLLLTLRGAPVVYYGDELGMPNVPIPPERIQDPWSAALPGGGRDPARTPMRWTRGPNAGFCPEHAMPWLPVGDELEAINVEDQRHDPGSMLALTKALLALRRACPALRGGNLRCLQGPPGAVVFSRVHDDERFLVAINTTAAPVEVPLPAGTSGIVRISSAMDRTGTCTTLPLRAHEACVLEWIPRS
ncbi:DUF3459 domain-containing protein [Pendulispora rubella]|uniref:DUF3459 domain-containing protein n=1 Tax=Pendulispora rubella TaxID=2741070 RepID=A0ABZ2KQ66_9BACT